MLYSRDQLKRDESGAADSILIKNNVYLCAMCMYHVNSSYIKSCFPDICVLCGVAMY